MGNGWYAYVSVFSGFSPEHECNVEKMGSNFTQDPSDPQCYALDLYNNQSVKCEHWSYDKSQMKSTIITDHNFVCEKNYHFELGYSIEQIGYVFGTLIFSYLADIVGRKPVLVGALTSMTVFGFIQYVFLDNFTVYIALGFVINLLACGLDAVCVTLVLEMFSTSKRTLFGIGIEVVWVLVLAMMAPVAYLIKEWKEIRLVIFICLALLSLVSHWGTQESIRWLISMSKLEEARKIIDRVVKYNRLDRKCPKTHSIQRDKLNKMFNELSEYNRMLDEQKKDKKINNPNQQQEKNKKNISLLSKEILYELNDRSSATIIDMFRNSKFRLYVLIMALNWFATALVYDGLTYLNNFIGENIFFNWIMMNLIELPAQFVCYYTVSRYGRRLTVCITLIVAGAVLLMTLVDLIDFFAHLTWVKLVLFVLAKFVLTQSYSGVILHAPELFPTQLRSSGYGLCLFSSKITSVFSPMISLYLSKIAPNLPAIIYGTISILCGLLSLYVPETLNRPLPNSIDDVVKWPRNLTRDEWHQVKELNKKEFNSKKIKKLILPCVAKKTEISPKMDSGKFAKNCAENKAMLSINSSNNSSGLNAQVPSCSSIEGGIEIRV